MQPFRTEFLAQRCGVSGDAVRDWSSGRKLPAASRVLKISDATGIPTETILRAIQAQREAAGK